MAQQHDPYSSPEERRAARRAEKAAKARLAEDDAVIQSLMSRESGRRYIHTLLGRCGIFTTSFTNDSHRTAFNEGQRNIGLILLADLMRACPQAYILMVQEAASGGRPDDYPTDRSDHDDERNYDSAGRWIGEGDGPNDEPASFTGL